MAFDIVVGDECIGCGVCVSLSDNFEVTDGKAHPKSVRVNEAGQNKEAAEACPVKCIHITEG
ncbi:ferredoxin [Nanoarchaeota archaeon]